jgi:energy-coupling factor transport system ATP-binding protein
MAEACIRAEGLSYTYLPGTPLAQTALRNIGFTLDAGRSLGIIGATGSGKSTLLQHFNGLILPQQGSLRVAGHRLHERGLDLKRLRRDVGLLFQRPEDQLFEHYLTDDIAYGPLAFGWDKQLIKEKIKRAMKTVGLDFDRYKDRTVRGLSGGERRKTAIAGVLVMEPRLLLLDEVTAGLDPSSREEIRRLLLDLKNSGTLLVLSDHDMENIRRLCDDILILENGSRRFYGSTWEAFRFIADGSGPGRAGLPPMAALTLDLQHRGLLANDVFPSDSGELIALLREKIGTKPPIKDKAGE